MLLIFELISYSVNHADFCIGEHHFEWIFYWAVGKKKVIDKWTVNCLVWLGHAVLCYQFSHPFGGQIGHGNWCRHHLPSHMHVPQWNCFGKFITNHLFAFQEILLFLRYAFVERWLYWIQWPPMGLLCIPWFCQQFLT